MGDFDGDGGEFEEIFGALGVGLGGWGGLAGEGEGEEEGGEEELKGFHW